MKITRKMMQDAVKAKLITSDQSQQLIAFFSHGSNQGAGFNLTNVLYYFGGLIAIAAMSLFMNLGWELFGGWGIVFLCSCYGLLGLALTQALHQRHYAIPAGICATFVISLTPLAIYGIQVAMHWWPDSTVYQEYHAHIKWHWLFMELGTLAVGAILAWIYRYPFMVMPIAVTLWYMSMDVTAMLGGGDYTFDLASKVSLYFGLGILVLAFWVDMRSEESMDYAFWLYIVGAMAFWSGLSSLHSDSELTKFVYLCVNVFLILLGVLLNRKVFVVFGALGVCVYLGYLAFQVFNFSYLFPVALSAIGFGIIYLGIIWQKNADRWTSTLQSFLPIAIKDRLQAKEEL